jgi:hypothetical protein
MVHGAPGISYHLVMWSFSTFVHPLSWSVPIVTLLLIDIDLSESTRVGEEGLLGCGHAVQYMVRERSWALADASRCARYAY